ncbi:hypothetical protein [Jannaschia formosa]|uniref:hypothetical protein n=1 Tax=Jannaschia formosa TaxID=2259592 RepID=UPI000E1BD575|nr:hypothetical protein [Jannaschia formosa]TFL18989.1 hypothetical protein DR046_06135 [Jannaschia formosa]
MRDPRQAFARSTGSRVWLRQAVQAAIAAALSAWLFALGGPVWPLLACVTLAIALGRGWQAWRLWRT